MFSNMKLAERKLLDACQKGEFLFLGQERPTEKTNDNEIRGEFLRALILSNNQLIINEKWEEYVLKIDPKGIRFFGIYVSGIFDFSFCNTDLPFVFINSKFENKLDLSDSKIRILNLSGSKINGLDAQGLKCESDIFLRDVFEAQGEVNFALAQINGSLSCKDGKFINEKGNALICNGAKIEGGVFLIDGFEVQGKLNFHSCYIGKSLMFNNGKEISSLILNSTQILLLQLDIANIQNIDLDGCAYEHLDSLKISDFLPKMPKDETFKPQPYKQLAKVLRNMGHQKEANDVMIEYNEQLRKKDFVTFDRLFISVFKWIYGKTSGYGYKPMKVFWTMLIVWFLCSLFYWKASSVAVFAPSNPLIFQHKDYKVKIADEGTAIGDFFNSKDYKCTDDTIECNNWTNSKLLDEEYTTFNPFMYSLDVILPIVDLQVEKDWGQYISSNNGTLNDVTRWLMWFEILFGWIYSLILVAILSGLAKNEKD